MRATIRWSYGLLSEGEREMFGRLSVFAGGFTLEAAEAVCRGGTIGESEVLQLLSGLANKSLVEADTEGRVRYRLLEPVRQYAREMLEEGTGATAVRDRHAAFFLALAEKAEPQLKGPGQVEWLQRLEEENDNLRAAMAWLLEKSEVETAVRLAFAQWVFWMIHGHQGEGRRWIEAALAKGEDLAMHARAKALQVQASTHYGLGSPEELERICDQALRLFRRVGDRLGEAYMLASKAVAIMQRGDVDKAAQLFKQVIGLGSELGEKWGVSGALSHLGSIYLGQGDYERATHYFEEGLALSQEIGNKLSVATALYNLALAAQGKEDNERAASLYTEGLRAATEAGDKANVAYCLDGLAQVAASQGEAERAARLFGAAETSLEAAGGVRFAYVQDRSLHEQAVGAIRSLLDEAAFSAARDAGTAMSPKEAFEYALSGEDRDRPTKTTARGRPSVGARPVVLTRREREVAALAARGLTNRRIASELSISEHTVANHIARILKKLGLGSRSQIVAWAIEQGQPTSDGI
jgi:DNA-binding CsgD family transcriptional regulator